MMTERTVDRKNKGHVCDLCPHACLLFEDRLGRCGTRTVENDRVVSLSYGKATSIALDPIEKKPLAHFHPGSHILSYGSFGCNLACSFCQNRDISFATARDYLGVHDISPDELVERALTLRSGGNIGIAFTYNEPFIAWEFMHDTAVLAREAGLVSVAVTNGYVTEKIWRKGLRHLDALNIDLKCFSDVGYHVLGASDGFAVVKRSIAEAIRSDVHIEITTLVVPGLSDDEGEFREECSWLGSLDPDVPLHITRYFPAPFERGSAPTDVDLMKRFSTIAKEHLNNVHIGNV